jgi:transposase-like protein
MNKRYTEEERQRHLALCVKNGLSILEYSKSNNLSPGIISSWRLRQQRLSAGKFEGVLLPGSLSGALTIWKNTKTSEI